MRAKTCVWVATLLLALAIGSGSAAQSNRDLTGVWIGPYTPNLARGLTLPFLPAAEEAFKKHRGEDDPTAVCLPPGTPRALGSPFPDRNPAGHPERDDSL